MKNSKGFTLVEIIGVIAVLAVIALVTAPQILRTLKKQEDKKYEVFLEDLSLSTSSFMSRNQDRFGDFRTPNDVTYIGIDELVSAGLVRSKTINPQTKSVISKTDAIKVTVNQNKDYNYELVSNNESTNGYVKTNIFAFYDGEQNGNVAGKWSDISGNNRTATLKNFNNNSKSGFNNRGLVFDGENDHVETPFTQADLGQTFTLSMVITINEVTKTKGLFGYYSSNTWKGVTAQAGDNDLLTFYTFRKDNARDVIAVHKDLFFKKSTQFTYVVKQNTGAELYINGVLSGVAYNTSQFDPYILTNFIIGASANISDRYANAKFNNFIIYKKALTPAEIEKNYRVDKLRYGL